MDIKQVTIIGTGLMGGSFGLALRKHGFRGRIVGCDRAEVLAQARELDAIDVGCEDPMVAAHGSDLILLATPVGGIIDLVEMGQAFPPHALITDVGSTKQVIMQRARAIFGEQAPRRFLPGHPMAGKEHSGIQYADPDLFTDAVWLVTPWPEQDIRAGLSGAFLQWLHKLGARVLQGGRMIHCHGNGLQHLRDLAGIVAMPGYEQNPGFHSARSKILNSF